MKTINITANLEATETIVHEIQVDMTNTKMKIANLDSLTMKETKVITRTKVPQTTITTTGEIRITEVHQSCAPVLS